MDEKRSRKGDVIRYVLETMDIADRSEVMMVGDREHDVSGALENGILCTGVLYGYGNREELVKAGAAYIIERPEELVRL